MKYTTVKVSGIITQIAETTELKGYTKGVLEIFFPDGHEDWSDNACNEWTEENNKRMEAICKFLNENGL